MNLKGIGALVEEWHGQESIYGRWSSPDFWMAQVEHDRQQGSYTLIVVDSSCFVLSKHRATWAVWKLAKHTCTRFAAKDTRTRVVLRVDMEYRTIWMQEAENGGNVIVLGRSSNKETFSRETLRDTKYEIFPNTVIFRIRYEIVNAPAKLY